MYVDCLLAKNRVICHKDTLFYLIVHNIFEKNMFERKKMYKEIIID